jgi:signal transduction histidine kinase
VQCLATSEKWGYDWVDLYQLCGYPGKQANMNVQIACPHCNNPVDPQARYCKHCGIDLALAAALAEQNIINLPESPKAPEALVPRLGEYLIEKGVLNQDGLQYALNYQKEKVKVGQACLIGQALVELGLIDRTALDQAVTEQILQLQLTLQQANQRLEKRVQERTADLQRALTKLTELSQLKTNFISNISHELRTPLTHLKGYLDMLADSSLGPVTPQQRDALQVLQRSEARLERLIEDLIQFSLATRGELSIKLSTFSLYDLLNSTLAQSDYKAKAKNVSIQMAIPEDLPLIRADEEKIGWVLMQLLDNAIKFTPNHGEVCVETLVEGEMVRISVADTGIGIPQERVEEIFEPFHQLDGSGTRQYPGTGLGLALVRRILDAHGATIKVHSVLGKGSRFEFSLAASTNSHA